MKKLTQDPRLVKVVAISLALPLAESKQGPQHTQFVVKKKTFAYYLADHHGDGITAICCKVLPGDHAALASSDPARFYLPAYIGSKGWVGLRLDVGEIDWEEVAELVAGSYRLVAPKALSRLLGAV